MFAMSFKMYLFSSEKSLKIIYILKTNWIHFIQILFRPVILNILEFQFFMYLHIVGTPSIFYRQGWLDTSTSQFIKTPALKKHAAKNKHRCFTNIYFWDFFGFHCLLMIRYSKFKRTRVAELSFVTEGTIKEYMYNFESLV